MKDPHSIAFLIPGVVGVAAILCTLLMHAVPLSATVALVRRERKRGRAGVRFWMDTGIVVRAMSYALVAHLVEMAFWAVLFMLCGEFSDFGTAYYHSAVNYTSLGYGDNDIIMSPAWRLLAPLETANGMLLFGVSAALIFTVVQRLVETRFSDLKG
jgi:hypothetical protein